MIEEWVVGLRYNNVYSFILIYSLTYLFIGLPFFLAKESIDISPLYVLLTILPPIAALCLFWYEWRAIAALEEQAEQITGTVIAADYRSGYGWNNYIPQINVKYTYNTTEYHNPPIFPNDATVYGTSHEIDTFLEDFEVGSETTVFVNPDDPTDAFLKPHPGATLLKWRVMWFSLTAGLGFLILLKAM